MILEKCILTANDCYKEGEKIDGGKPTGIVVHSTGAANKELRRYVQPLKSYEDYDKIIADLGVNKYGNHWNQSKEKMGRSVCVHAFIGVNAAGQIKTYQTLPFDICCWGVGAIPLDKNGNPVSSSKSKNFHHYGPSYNYNPQARVQFEICEDNLKDENYFNKVMKEAQEFCAYLCKMFGFGVNKISSHYESYWEGYGGNHSDPHEWLEKFGKDMDWFRAEVDKLLKEDAEPEKEETETDDIYYYVQTGAYSSKENAKNQLVKVKAAGFDAVIKQSGKLYKVQVGAYKNFTYAMDMEAKLIAAGFEAFITRTGGTVVAVTSKDEGFKIGDKVKCKAGVTKFANGKKMSAWVPTATLYVRGIESDGKILLVSIEKTKKEYTGRVNASDVVKF